MLYHNMEGILCISVHHRWHIHPYYPHFLPSQAHITKVDYSYEADTYISDFDKLKDWRITGQSDEHTYFDICYEFVRYERKGKADEMPE